MEKVAFKASNVFSDISRFINLLKDLKKSKIQVEGLDSLMTELNKKLNDQNNWKLNTKLRFKNINKKDLKIPEQILQNVKEIILELKISITEKSYTVNSICDSIIQDRNVVYGVQFVTYGKTADDLEKYKMSWHLDKHIRNYDNDDGRGKGFIHPEYHFNMGGFVLTKSNDFNFGNVLLTNTPRICHPPLDIILSIDFVLKNFYGVRVKNLTDSNQYKKIISTSKQRLWRPYFICVANHWESKRFDDLNIEVNFAEKIFGEV